MNKDDIIRMALESGMIVYEGDQDRVLFEGGIMECLKRFVAKAVEAEREACARVCEAEMEPYCGFDKESYAGCRALTSAAAAIRARGQA